MNKIYVYSLFCCLHIASMGKLKDTQLDNVLCVNEVKEIELCSGVWVFSELTSWRELDLMRQRA